MILYLVTAHLPPLTNHLNRLQAIIFIGIQATGKSTFYRQFFFNSHVRISMDLLRTRNRENRFLEACFATSARFIVDNTNPTKEERARYISLAKQHRYAVIGYYFKSDISKVLARNKMREGKELIPEKGIYGCRKRLVLPAFSEGFDKLYEVQLNQDIFDVRDWHK